MLKKISKSTRHELECFATAAYKFDLFCILS